MNFKPNFNRIHNINFKKKSTIAAIVFWIIAFIIALIVVDYGSTNSFGLDIFTAEHRAEINADFSHSYEYTHEAEDISGIDIRWQSGDVEVKYVRGASKIQITETTPKELGNTGRLIIEDEDGVLLIKWDEQTDLAEIMRGEYDKNLVVVIPTELELASVRISNVDGSIAADSTLAEEITINTTACDVTAIGCKADSIKIATTSGNIVADGSKANTMKLTSISGSISAENAIGYDLRLDSVSGEISVSGAFTNLKAASTSGDITASTEVLPEQIDISGVSANVDLTVPEDTYVKVSVDSVSGEMSTDFEELDEEVFVEPEVSDDEEDEKEKFIDIQTTSGDISLTKGAVSVILEELFPEPVEEEE